MSPDLQGKVGTADEMLLYGTVVSRGDYLFAVELYAKPGEPMEWIEFASLAMVSQFAGVEAETDDVRTVIFFGRAMDDPAQTQANWYFSDLLTAGYHVIRGNGLMVSAHGRADADAN